MTFDLVTDTPFDTIYRSGSKGKVIGSNLKVTGEVNKSSVIVGVANRGGKEDLNRPTPALQFPAMILCRLLTDTRKIGSECFCSPRNSWR